MTETESTDRFGISSRQWGHLIRRIRKGECVPIVGSELLKDVVPSREQLAEEWAKEIEYPLARTSELSMVAEFEMYKNNSARDDPYGLLTSFEEFAVPFASTYSTTWRDDKEHPLRILASMPFTTFVTTSYFGALEEAIRLSRPKAEPASVSCRWNPPGRNWTPHLADSIDDFEPTVQKPLVFHLHGRIDEPDSLVLTERDHMVFTDLLSRDNTTVDRSDTWSMVPAPVVRALSKSSWFFVGYGASDRNLRGLLRALGEQVKGTVPAVAVQLQKDDAATGRRQAADDFLTAYFRRLLDRGAEVVLEDVSVFLAAIRDDVRQSVAAAETEQRPDLDRVSP